MITAPTHAEQVAIPVALSNLLDIVCSHYGALKGRLALLSSVQERICFSHGVVDVRKVSEVLFSELRKAPC